MKFEKKVKALTPEQNELIKTLAVKEATTMIAGISSVIYNCFFNAMRESHIGAKRAQEIMDRAGVLMDLEGKK